MSSPFSSGKKEAAQKKFFDSFPVPILNSQPLLSKSHAHEGNRTVASMSSNHDLVK